MAVDSACSNRLLSLKFVGDTLSVSALISLLTSIFDNILTLKLCAREVGNLPTNFGVSGTFRSRYMGQQLPDGSRDFATFTFALTLEVRRLSAIRVFVLHLYTKLEVRRFSVRKI